MRNISLKRLTFFIGLIIYFSLSARCFGVQVIDKVNVTPHLWTPENIHIKYSFTRTLPAAPKEFLDKHIAKLNEKIKSAEKSPGGENAVFTNKQFKENWQRRYTTSPPEYGQAEYWGTKSGMIWSNGRTAYAYNGKYTSSAHPNDIFPNLFKDGSKPQWFHVMPGTESLDLVPYLGFMQPGKELLTVKSSAKRKTASGFEVRRNIEDKKHGASYTLVARFNAQGKLITVTKQVLDLVLQQTLFSDYKFGNNYVYPQNVSVTTYLPYKSGESVRTFPNEVVVYKVQSADTKPINAALFDANYPRIGVVVQDWRYQSKSRPDGIQYMYTDKRLTVEQASEMAARQNAVQDDNQSPWTRWFGTSLRFISLALICLVVVRAVSNLIRKRAA